MKTLKTITTAARSSRSHRLIGTAILAALITSFSAVCNAAEVGGAPQAVVKFGDLDLSTSQGAATLYGRIHAASRSVCSPLDHGDFQAMFRWQKCVQQATAGAVAQVNRPALTALYAEKYGMPQPARILTADRR